MTRVDSLVAELAHETTTTRRLVERLPADQLDWRPHPKSSTAGQLASHMVDCIRWVEPVFGGDELDMDTAGYKPFAARSVPSLLATFDGDVAKAKQAMSSTADITAGSSPSTCACSRCPCLARTVPPQMTAEESLRRRGPLG